MGDAHGESRWRSRPGKSADLALPGTGTCQFNYTPPLHFAVREGHLPLVKALVAEKGIDPSFKSYPFGDSFLTMAQDRGNDDVALFLQDALARPELIRKWKDTGEIDYDRTRDSGSSTGQCTRATCTTSNACSVIALSLRATRCHRGPRVFS